jgi:hypothetical protein
LLLLAGWTYFTFLRSSTLTIGLPDRDAQRLRQSVLRDQRVQFQPIVIPGSREGVELLSSGQVDLAFIQGGVAIPPELPRLETTNPEVVLWFLRDTVGDTDDVKRILTSVAGEGSHTVAQRFVSAWNIEGRVQYVHAWKQLTDNARYAIPDDVDAVFVVKDPADEKTLQGAVRLVAAGFRLVSPELGARAQNYEFLVPHVIPAGYLQQTPPIPSQPTATYVVTTYLVARQGLTPRLLATASHLLEARPPAISELGFEPTMRETSDLLQGVEAFLGTLINTALAFLALLGWEMLAYRKRFHELNSLISLISVHQSTKDVLGVNDSALRQSNLQYLSLCSDLLGLISMIAGYYTQENSSLLFSSLPEIIHQRCDGLKINIQLKILHATIELMPTGAPLDGNASSLPTAGTTEVTVK